jgi:hypothetical protein
VHFRIIVFRVKHESTKVTPDVSNRAENPKIRARSEVRYVMDGIEANEY